MKRRLSICLALVAVFIIAQPIVAQTFGATLTFYGDPNVEQWSSTIGGDLVQAYSMITVDSPTVLHSISMFLQYSGSDGSQCMYFGIYQDNGSWNPAGQPLVVATSHAYCLRSAATWGPAWQTWKLIPSDYLIISTPGTYWLCTLAKQTYGTIFHYSYAGAYDYTYGYSDYFFVAPFANGFPQFFSPNPASETNGPYSLYATGISP
jgi:hypothetical protein